MGLPSPDLDDRSFEQLVQEAKSYVARRGGAWTDLSAHDPGVVLLEAFAYLTELLLYRVNRIPEKVYVELLRLIGVRRFPPCAASTRLVFERAPKDASRALKIPEGTRVAASAGADDGAPAIFITGETVELGPGASTVSVAAHHCDASSEVLGSGTGLPGQTFWVSRPPIVAPLPGGVDLVVGVELAAGEDASTSRARRDGETSYRVWREVESFAESGDYIYSVDRVEGRISFSPVLEREPERFGGGRSAPQVPGDGLAIRVWYRTGGGSSGNVPAGTITQLRDSVGPGLSVTNPAAAQGGRETESVDAALRRGPLELHSLRRAVTARDFESWCVHTSGVINRAIARAQRELWRYGSTGVVELRLVPEIPEAQCPEGRVTQTQLRSACENATQDALPTLLGQLNDRMVVGTRCVARWALFKQVTVHATIRAYRNEDLIALEQRLREKLYRRLSPLRRAGTNTWNFGDALQVWHIHSLIGAVPGSVLDEPGVKSVEDVELEVEFAPERDVRSIARDPHHEGIWFAASGSRLFRSHNDGIGWDLLLDLDDESIRKVVVHPERPGYLAVLSRSSEATSLPAAAPSKEEDASPARSNTAGARLRLSYDLGEQFELISSSHSEISDLAWAERGGEACLFVAGSVGLRRIQLGRDAIDEPLTVDPRNSTMPLWAVATCRDEEGRLNVAVAARESGGVYLSCTGGRSEQYRRIGLESKDVRILEAGADGSYFFLWAGMMEDRTGHGCARWRLAGAENPGWEEFGTEWIRTETRDAGSCVDLALGAEAGVVAATGRGGVLRLERPAPDARWQHPAPDAAIPRDDPGDFMRIDCIDWDPQRGILLAGGAWGIVRGVESAAPTAAAAGLPTPTHLGQFQYRAAAARRFRESVTVSPVGLFCSGEHRLRIIHEDET